MFYTDPIRDVHLEITERCNASCPQCARNINGGRENPHIGNHELSLGDIINFFPLDVLSSVKRLYMCGNYGDPVVATDTVEIFRYLNTIAPHIQLGLHTNGSLRKSEWWKDLAESLGPNGYCTFSIDGLADTNHLYRRGTNFQTIMSNAETFILHGGKANWDFIVFEHNQHQVEDARQLATKMGFNKFRIKKTGRFFSNATMQFKTEHDVLNRNGDKEYSIKPSTLSEFKNASKDKANDIVKSFGSMDDYLNQTQISCKVQSDTSVYVSARGYLFPCCWTGQIYNWWSKFEDNEIVQLIEKNGGFDEVDLRKKALADIVSGPIFSAIETSFGETDIACGKLKVCSKICGQLLDKFQDQF